MILTGLVSACPAAAFDIEPWGPASASSQRHFALLLVHGLGSDPKTTFGRWPEVIHADNQALIDEDYGGQEPFKVSLSDFDIFLARYETKATGMSIAEIGRQFADAIEAPDSIFRQYDMVFIVVHSLGGVELHQAFDTLANKGHRDIWFRFLPAALELGVPVNGSAFADVAARFSPLVVDWLGYNPGLVDELKTDSKYLGALNANWTETVTSRMKTEGWPIVYCGYETKAQSAIADYLRLTDGKVVPSLYASDACTGGAKNPLDKTHIDLPKVESEKDDAHKLLRKMVQETLLSLKDKRYVQKDRSATLHDALARIADETNDRFAVDRATGVRAYKQRIRFDDPKDVTRVIATQEQLKGWSADNAVRRAVGPYPCVRLAETSDGAALEVKVDPDAPCK